MLDITVECAYPGCSRRFERLKVTGKYCPECRKNSQCARDIKILRPGETRCSACRRIFTLSWDGQDLCYCCVQPEVVSPVQVRGYSPLKPGPMAYVYPVQVIRGKTVWDITSPELGQDDP